MKPKLSMIVLLLVLALPCAFAGMRNDGRLTISIIVVPANTVVPPPAPEPPDPNAIGIAPADQPVGKCIEPPKGVHAAKCLKQTTTAPVVATK
jgi:hypothetical protein